MKASAIANRRTRPGKVVSAEILACLLIALLGGYWRFTHLGADSFWLDELFTLRTARHGLIPILQVRDHPPLHYLLVSASVGALGESEWAVRLPSAVAGVLALPLMVLFGRAIGRPRAGMWAALLLALSPFHLRYSQEARPYALLMTLTLASHLLLYQALTRGRLRWWLAYALAIVLALYTHYGALIVLASQAVVIAGWMATQVRRGEPRLASRPLAAAALALALYLPWLSKAYAVLTGNTGGQAVAGTVGPAPLAVWLRETLTAFGFAWGPLPLLVAVLCTLGLIVWLRERHWAALAIIASALIVPFLLIAASSVARWAYPKYVIYILPAYLLAAGVGLEGPLRIATRPRTARGRRTYAAGSAMVAVGLLAVAWPLLRQEHAYVERDWRGLASYLKSITNDGDVVISMTIDQAHDGFNRGGIALPYYLSQVGAECVFLASDWMRLEDAQALAGLDADVWGVLFDRREPAQFDQDVVEVHSLPGALYVVHLRAQGGTALERTTRLYEQILPLALTPYPQCLLHQDMAALYVTAGEYRKAERMLAARRRQCPDRTSGYVRYDLPSSIYRTGLETCLRAGDEIQARRLAMELLKLDPKDAQALRVLTVENLLQRFEAGQAQVRDNAAPEPVQVRRYSMPRNGDWGDVLLVHPPASVSYRLQLPQRPAALRFRIAMAPESWDWGGDGSTFVVSIEAGSGLVELFRQQVGNDLAERNWHSALVSLEAYAGQSVTLTLATEEGPRGDATGDWAGWETPRIIWQPPMKEASGP